MADDPEPLAEEASAPPAKPRKPAPAPVADPDGWPRWVYSGTPRIYTHIPVTVDDGDVVEWPEIPSDDGSWAVTDQPATRRPDNHTEG